MCGEAGPVLAATVGKCRTGRGRSACRGPDASATLLHQQGLSVPTSLSRADCWRLVSRRTLFCLSAQAPARSAARARFERRLWPPERLEEAMREEDVPAQQPKAEEEARLSSPHADPWRSRGAGASARQAPREPLGLIWRVRERSSFRTLARGRRLRSGSLEMRTAILGRPDDPPRISFAVARSVGNAPARNRVRRQLRSATREHRQLLETGRGYLFRAADAGPYASADVDRAVADLLQRAGARS
jgi:ribonuclease P protein component